MDADEADRTGSARRRRVLGVAGLGVVVALVALALASALLGWPARTEAYDGVVFEDGCGGATIEVVPVGAGEGAEVIEGLAPPAGAAEVAWPARAPVERRSSWWGGDATWTVVVGDQRVDLEPVDFTRIRCDPLLR